MIRSRSIALGLLGGLLVALPLGAQGTMPSTQIHGFADVTYFGGPKSPRPSAFGLGQYDLYITSKLTDRLSMAGESVFEYEESSRDFAVDVERLAITYDLSRYARITAGKVHTPIGYWNDAYHHGEAMAPTINRPTLFAFEDDGGVLPIHSTGIQLSGRDIGGAHVGYDLLVANGVGGTPVSDTHDRKAVTVAAHAQLTTALRIGASVFGDRLGAGDVTPRGDTLGASRNERAAGGYVAFLGARAELIGEYQRIDVRGGGTHPSESHGVATYAGYRVRQLVPYARFDDVRVPDADTFLPRTASRLGAVGVRWEIDAMAVTKLELRRRRDGAVHASEIGAQVAVGF